MSSVEPVVVQQVVSTGPKISSLPGPHEVIAGPDVNMPGGNSPGAPGARVEGLLSDVAIRQPATKSWSVPSRRCRRGSSRRAVPVVSSRHEAPSHVLRRIVGPTMARTRRADLRPSWSPLAPWLNSPPRLSQPAKMSVVGVGVSVGVASVGVAVSTGGADGSPSVAVGPLVVSRRPLGSASQRRSPMAWVWPLVRLPGSTARPDWPRQHRRPSAALLQPRR